MKAWFKRFGLHLAAAVGATGIFVTAAAVGANQTRQQVASVVGVQATPSASAAAARKLTAGPSPAAVGTETAGPATSASAAPVASASAIAGSQTSPAQQRTPTAAASAQRVIPERSIAGSIQKVSGEGLEVLTAAGKEFHVKPVPGALIRLNGKAAKLEQLEPGDVVVILGQAQPGASQRFVAHAITARRA